MSARPAPLARLSLRLALVPMTTALIAAALAVPSVRADESTGDEIPAGVPAIIEAHGEDQRAIEYLDGLVNGIGARLTASPRDVRACEWARDELKKMGLEARIEKAGEFPVAFSRGPWFGRMVAPETMELEFGTPAWSAGTRGKVRARALRMPESVDEITADHEGAWLLTQRQRRRMSREARQNARAVREALDALGIAGTISPTTSDTYITTNGNPRLDPNDLPTIPRINMLKPHWEKVAAKIDAGETVELEFDIRNHFLPGPAPYYNVIADIPGREKPDEYVVIGAHIDSWDGATGTTDDGCGVAVALEAARLLTEAGVRPYRTIRICLWSGEEQGLLGSRAYLDQYASTLDQTSGAFVFDGGPNVISGVDATPAMKADFDLVFGPLAEFSEKFPFEIEVHEDGLPRGIGSDHDAFLGKGVPGFFWQQDGRADWRHGIHTQFDTFDLAIEEYIEHSALTAAIAVFGVAELPHLLSRKKLLPPPPRRMGIFPSGDDGLTIGRVIEGTPAAKAGLQNGDVLVSIDGENLGEDLSLRRALRKGGPRKTIVVKRGSETITAELVWEDEIRRAAEEEKADEAEKENEKDDEESEAKPTSEKL